MINNLVSVLEVVGGHDSLETIVVSKHEGYSHLLLSWLLLLLLLLLFFLLLLMLVITLYCQSLWKAGLPLIWFEAVSTPPPPPWPLCFTIMMMMMIMA